TPQPEATEQPGETKLQRMLREDGELRGQVEQLVQNVEAQRQQAQAQYEQAAATAAGQVNAFIAAIIPELAGVTDDRIAQDRLNQLRMSNPQRYNEVYNIISR